MSNSIDSSLFLSNKPKPTKQTGQQSLGKDDFLKILMVQLQNQDPANPMKDKEFISQMATFSSLEQMTNLSESMQDFIGLQKKSSMANFSQYIGKEVSWEKTIESQEEGGEPIVSTGSGIVESLEVNGEKVLLSLENGTMVTTDQITKLTPVAENSMNPGFNKYAAASTLIGKQVTILDANTNEPTDYQVKSAHFNNGKITYELDNGSIIDPTSILKISM